MHPKLRVETLLRKQQSKAKRNEKRGLMGDYKVVGMGSI